MIPMKSTGRGLATPQSPLMSGKETQQRRRLARSLKNRVDIPSKEWVKLRKPITAKITSTAPLCDFYWGKQVPLSTLTPRMLSLQKGKFLSFFF